MTESRTLTPAQALEWLLESVAVILNSSLYVEDLAGALTDIPALAALEDAYDAVMSFQIEDATPEAQP